MALKMNFECESYALLKQCINDTQRSMWQEEVDPCGDAPPYLTFFYNLIFK
jgi:hypothetical protein